MQLPADTNRNLVQANLKAQGIPTMVYYPKAMSSQVAFDGRCCVPEPCVVTNHLCKTVLALPMGPYLKKGEVEAVAEAIGELL